MFSINVNEVKCTTLMFTVFRVNLFLVSEIFY